MTLDANTDIYLVDEIGNMECLSAHFIAVIQKLLSRTRSVIATITLRGGGFIAEAKQAVGVAAWE